MPERLWVLEHRGDGVVHRTTACDETEVRRWSLFEHPDGVNHLRDGARLCAACFPHRALYGPVADPGTDGTRTYVRDDRANPTGLSVDSGATDGSEK